MQLWQYVARRLALLPILIIGITLLAFIVSHLVPADPLGMVLSERAMNNPTIVAAYRARWGYDRPLPEQYLIYVRNLAHGDLGESIATQRPVLQDLAQFFPATLELTLAAMVFTVFLGIPLGVVAAIFRDRWPDHLARILALIGVSVPVFWLGLLLLNVFYFHLDWLPGPGRLDADIPPPPHITGLYTLDSLLTGQWATLRNALAHLLLPALVLGAYTMGAVSRMTRSSLLDVLGQDYMRTAKAKGLSRSAQILRHALRNALIPTVTVVGLAFGDLMSGAVLTETIFSWPGMGRYAVNAASFLDLQAIMGVTVIIATTYILVNLAADISYGLLDPRIRIGG
ncbi:MAG: ABC transporter permease [Caldilineae bacterium]|nr:MAG: ABC transporter permease [Caldilineae bacterium]